MTTVNTEINPIYNNNTYIVALIDKSGSMSSQGTAPASKLNGFITDQVGDVTADVWTFSSHDTCKKIITMMPSIKVNITQEQMYPSGSTAFWSSVCCVIDDMISTISNISIMPKTIILVLYTEGMDNDSRDEYNGNNGCILTKNKIENIKLQFNTIVYLLGANINSKELGKSIGISPEYCIDYHHSEEGCTNVFTSASNSVKRLRSSYRMDSTVESRKEASQFTNEERLFSINVHPRSSSLPLYKLQRTESYIPLSLNKNLTDAQLIATPEFKQFVNDKLTMHNGLLQFVGLDNMGDQKMLDFNNRMSHIYQFRNSLQNLD